MQRCLLALPSAPLPIVGSSGLSIKNHTTPSPMKSNLTSRHPARWLTGLLCAGLVAIALSAIADDEHHRSHHDSGHGYTHHYNSHYSGHSDGHSSGHSDHSNGHSNGHSSRPDYDHHSEYHNGNYDDDSVYSNHYHGHSSYGHSSYGHSHHHSLTFSLFGH